MPRASLIVVLARSPALVASVTAALRDSAVGGGMLMTSRRGLAPVGSGWGVRLRLLDWMDVVMGLMCWEGWC